MLTENEISEGAAALFAVKVLEEPDDDESVDDFSAELALWKRIKAATVRAHSGLLKPVAIFAQPNGTHIFLEYMEYSLKEILQLLDIRTTAGAECVAKFRAQLADYIMSS